MKNSRKTKKMPRFMKTFSDISRIFVLSSAISVSITSILLIINSVTGVFIGFRYYIMLALGMIIMLTPCWILCDCKRIFGRQPRRVIKSKSVRNKRTSRSKETIRRRKIS
ncbi:MAG: hypothetical protein KZY55_04940 [Paeniclostridium sp.]|uniref:hypothetical protein n=1 Tax=Paraclostridium sordellii TaxID=1505 RepID=UPI0005DE6538|nr:MULTISPECIES: hypothetical protein [Paeniclostridium]MBW4863739.1 hypothetical protein [Paeniclostridium sp.]MBW4873389.1 hypothetical protein [Paeniclostridium sp.]CEN93150.1 Uncharacterised protein [[Clostridium] sordellii] [Paeniclostridium sordellii]CEN95634.1 Uncharacterised protein [[Clostridium] sordellii] [Paeniclostridium sordellii]